MFETLRQQGLINQDEFNLLNSLNGQNAVLKFNENISEEFLEKVREKLQLVKPDIVVEQESEREEIELPEETELKAPNI